MKQSLRFFVLRAESRRLYREFMKITRRETNQEQQKVMRIWIRDDFKLNKNLTDEVRIANTLDLLQSN